MNFEKGAQMKVLSEDAKKKILNSIRTVPDFPKAGIQFKDITTLLNNAEALKILMDHLEDRYCDMQLDYIAGIESRGFIFGSILADRLGVGFVPVRKKGKLPYTTISEKYSLEYGFDEVEIHIDAFKKKDAEQKSPARVLLIDDLIATGGTAAAAARLVERAGAKCVECCFIIELAFLDGRKQIDAPIYSVISL